MTFNWQAAARAVIHCTVGVLVCILVGAYISWVMTSVVGWLTVVIFGPEWNTDWCWVSVAILYAFHIIFVGAIIAGFREDV
jgi:hypothetical protein